MSPETLTALQQSIAKWERNAAAEGSFDATVAWRNCALCVLYYQSECAGCPVAEAGHQYCERTPYLRASDALEDWMDGDAHAKERFRAASLAEVDFLKLLLPQKVKS